MSGSTRMVLGWPAALAAGIALLAIGAGGTFFVLRPGLRSVVPQAAPPNTSAPAPAASGGSTTTSSGSAQALPDVIVALTPEAVERAGITTTAVTARTGRSAIHLPGIVEPNAYKQVVVTPLVGGRITRVLVELGQNVRRGQTLAEIFSPELAEAETRYISARADLEAHERELQRTEKLVELGAASRQELEHLHAEHTGRITALESAKSRLELLGLSNEAIASLAPGKDAAATTSVQAPLSGVVTERTANPGLNVDTASKLFTVVDLSTVWVVANLYEKDFSRARVGATATVTTRASSESFSGRVSYFDPQIDSQTRTAKVRIEVTNARGELRLGMFADVNIDVPGGTPTLRVPRKAVQNVGDRTVVYVAVPNQPGRFIEREVRVGDSSEDEIEILSGVAVGDTVVVEGSFLVRAERERLGLRAR